ncbi:unnamed protein product [Pleuronectes platessa]|uniref:Uncharacterized protein n=1 Tax=Pleuronectes platessa TaxID=8262 RepID=A0A9N7YYF9_PLEPL|nr:unnamed protein product [Pleuronectes platessa]
MDDSFWLSSAVISTGGGASVRRGLIDGLFGPQRRGAGVWLRAELQMFHVLRVRGRSRPPVLSVREEPTSCAQCEGGADLLCSVRGRSQPPALSVREEPTSCSQCEGGANLLLSV